MFPLLGGLLGSLLPNLFMMNTQKKQRQNINRMMDEARASIGEAKKRAGITPEARAENLRRQRELLRAGQAQRGIFESGIAGQQEAELEPQWEQQMRDYETRQWLNIANQYGSLLGAVGGGPSMSGYEGMAQAASPYLGAMGMMGGERLGQALFPGSQEGRIY